MTDEKTSPERAIDAELGRRINARMWDAKVTQMALAPRLGLDQSSLSKKMRGDRPWYWREVVIVAEVLGVTVGELAGETPA